jgi:ribonuclease HII
MLRGERALWRAGVRHVAGVDEVGVGPLAGPVVAAAVVFQAGTNLAGVDDSKRLDPETRTVLAAAIRARAIGVGIGAASVDEIDRLNVYHAGLLAMRRAVEALPVTPQHVLVDARTVPGLSVSQRAIVRGDETCFSIAAASIVAKAYRDQLMTDLDRQYPQYGFRRHKGYATAEHQAAIRRHGPCALHRQSYNFLRELRGQYSPRFYEIKDRLAGMPGTATLCAIAQELRRNAAELTEPERHKLKLLLARRQALL